MESERDEVYERIPWETIEQKGPDRQWIVYALAGAVALGALAYSFMRNQPTAGPPPQAVVATTVPATVTTPEIATTPTTVASPIVVAEADLYAIDPERVFDQASAYAEWFAVEYVALDGSVESQEILASLLPAGVPLPSAPAGTQVFVDWARTSSITQTGPVNFDVMVLVRSLVSSGDKGFIRQAPLMLTVGVEIGEDGAPAVLGVPSVATATPGPAPKLAFSEVPEELVAGLGEVEVVGGVQQTDGSWDIIVMQTGPDGVKRPVTVHP